MNDKERLEEIKKKCSEVTVLGYIDDIEIVGVDMKDLVWLIQYVEELEEREKIYKEIIQSYGKIADGFVDDIERLVKRNEHYKQALEFYAERDNYQWEVSYRPQQEIDCMVIDDSGHIARQALKGE